MITLKIFYPGCDYGPIKTFLYFDQGVLTFACDCIILLDHFKGVRKASTDGEVHLWYCEEI